MADPNSIPDIIDVQVNFVPVVAVGRFGFANPTFVAEFAASASFPGRIKEYTGTVTDKLAALVADGFSMTSETFRQVQSANLQDGPARVMYVGRKDAGDADWGDAVEAVKAAADLEGLAFYVFVAATRDAAEIEAISDFLEGDPLAPVFAFYLAQTVDDAVLNNTPGNVALNILAKNYQRTALLYHDPETSSQFGPAKLQSTRGTFTIANGDDLQFRVDGGALQTTTFSAIAATLLGANAETFAVTNGDQLIVAANGDPAQTITFVAVAASITNGITETYNFANNMILSVRVNGTAAQSVVFNGTAGAAATGASPFALADGETVTFDIDGTGSQVVTFNIADFASIIAATSAELAAVYTTQLTGVAVDDDGSVVTVLSSRLGASSDVEIVAGTGGALAALSYSVGNNLGTGGTTSIPFLDATTAAEAAAEINADTTGLTASDVAGSVNIVSDTEGTGSRIQVTGGTANNVLFFSTNEVTGSGDFLDASVATAQEIVDRLAPNLQGIIALTEVGAIRLTSRIAGTDSLLDVDVSAIATVLGLSFTPVVGTGDFGNANLATAGEVAAAITNTPLVSAVASSAESSVVLESSTSGVASTLEIVGGEALSILRFEDAIFGTTNSAIGVGVQEDFADAAWVGRCVTFDLDSPDGAALWDKHTLKASSPTGAGTVTLAGDRNISKAQRSVLHNTLRVNTYELRLGRNETHFGTLLNDQMGAGGFIDIRTTMDWYDARITEDFNIILSTAADTKLKVFYLPSGIDKFDNAYRRRLSIGDANAHTVFDDSPLDLNDPQDTGLFTPSIASQTQDNINNRKVSGFQARQLVKGGIQKAGVILNLIGPTSELGA